MGPILRGRYKEVYIVLFNYLCHLNVYTHTYKEKEKYKITHWKLQPQKINNSSHTKLNGHLISQKRDDHLVFCWTWEAISGIILVFFGYFQLFSELLTFQNKNFPILKIKWGFIVWPKSPKFLRLHFRIKK